MFNPVTPLLSYLRRDEQLAIHVVIGLLAGYLLLTLFVYLLPTSVWDVEFSTEVQEHQSSRASRAVT